jgi:hypothetical protein
MDRYAGRVWARERENGLYDVAGVGFGVGFDDQPKATDRVEYVDPW